MIIGIGIDSAEIHRFAQWHTFSRKKLSRIFSDQEIDYCLQLTHKSAERFAVRFAAREALFKALSVAFPDLFIPFLTLCKAVSIIKQKNRPEIIIDREMLSIKNHPYAVHLSLTHTNNIATAFIIIE